MPKSSQEEITEKIDTIIEFIYSLASGDLSHQLPRFDEDSNENDLDAITEGLNMLAEELEATMVSRDAYSKTLQELKETQSQLVQAAKLASLGEMATGIAHEINQPLQIVMMHSEKGLESLEEMNKEQLKESLGVIKSQVKRAAMIIWHLKAFSRNSVTERRDAISINKIIENALTLTGSQLENQGIDITIEVVEDLPSIICNKNQIEQVLINLLLNAKDAMKSSSPRQLTIRSFQENAFLIVEVEDTGIGVSSDIEHKIFDPFFTAKDVGTGTGLGLSISYNLLQDHHGNLKLRKKQGQGTIFRIELPLKEAHGNLSD